MKTWAQRFLKSQNHEGNPNHDPSNGQFSSGGGSSKSSPKSKDSKPKSSIPDGPTYVNHKELPYGDRPSKPKTSRPIGLGTRNKRIKKLHTVLKQYTEQEKEFDKSFFKGEAINPSTKKPYTNQEYMERNKKVGDAFESAAQIYIDNLHNPQALKGKQTINSISISPDALGADTSLGNYSKEHHDLEKESRKHIQAGIDSVFSKMSTTIGKRIGPIKQATIVKNDNPKLVSADGTRNLLAYDAHTRSIYISNAIAGNPEALKKATAYATCHHAYAQGPQKVRDHLQAVFRDKVGNNQVNTDIFGESHPCIESRGFWDKYQGVIPVKEDAHGLQNIDIEHAGMNMAAIAFATISSGDKKLLGRVMRDPEHRKTLFQSLKIFNAIAVKGGDENIA